MGKLKQQYTAGEPDWCNNPSQQQQQQHNHQWNHHQPRGQVESREHTYWGGNNGNNARGVGVNSIIADERDTRMPMNNYQYTTSMGRGQALSPRQYQYQQQQQIMSSREVASYMAAVKAVNDSMNSGGHGGITALRGLWKVFDAAVSELGTDLNDSLSNKAIFEANVTQDNLLRQGKKISEFQKKSDALSRKKHYESELKSTMLRLRGSFADVILGTKKELQNSIDQSFAVQTAEIEKSVAKSSVEMEKHFTRKAIEAEQSFAMQLKEKDMAFAMSLAKKKVQMEQTFAKKSAEMERSFTKENESNRDSANIEIAQLHSGLIQAEQTTHMVQAQLSQSEQASNMVRAQLVQERESYHQAIAKVEKSRDGAATKLSSTLDTLQNTCASAQSVEMKLHETEERLQYVERERRQENDAANQQWSIENERAGLLQNKLDSEVKNKNALISVQREMEKHLSLERKRGDLLQQELDAETQSKQEIVASLQEADSQRRGELDRAHQENMHLRSGHEQLMSAHEQLKSVHEQVKCELDGASQGNMHLHQQLKRANEVGSSLKASLNGLQRKFEEQVGILHASKSEYSQLASEFEACKMTLNKTAEMNSLLEAKVEMLDAKVQDQVMDLEAARMSEAEVERRGEELEAHIHKLEAQLKTKTDQLAEKCHQSGEYVAALEEATELTTQLNSERDVLTGKLKLVGEWNDSLESESDSLKEKLRMVENDYSEDRDKIANALAGFDEELTNAEAKLKSVLAEKESLEGDLRRTESSALRDLEEERMKVCSAEEKIDALQDKIQDLTDAQQKEAGERATENDTLKEKIENEKKKTEDEKSELEDEKMKLQDEISNVKDTCNTKVSKYESDIGVYEEAIKMLQKQVDILQELADADCEKCAESTKIESRHEDLKEETRQVLSQMNTQKLEHDSVMMNKNADIAALREKCQSREEAMKQLDKLCQKARRDLLTLRDQKTHLEGSLERSIMYIKDLRQSQESIDAGSTDAIEIVATSHTSPRKGSIVGFHDDILDDICAPIDSAQGLKLPGSLKDLGSELDALITHIETQLGVGK